MREALRKWRVRRVSRFIVDRLRANGITVSGEFGIRNRAITPDDDCRLLALGSSSLYGGCEIFADVLPHQRQAYGAVYAEAIQKFRWLTPKQICLAAYPKEPLEKEWASAHSFTEYFAEEYYVPCEDCGKVEKWHSLEWGDCAAHEERWSSRDTYYFKDEKRKPRTVLGHLCRSCWDKLGWSSASGCMLRKQKTA